MVFPKRTNDFFKRRNDTVSTNLGIFPFVFKQMRSLLVRYLRWVLHKCLDYKCGEFFFTFSLSMDIFFKMPAFRESLVKVQCNNQFHWTIHQIAQTWKNISFLFSILIIELKSHMKLFQLSKIMLFPREQMKIII